MLPMQTSSKEPSMALQHQPFDSTNSNHRHHHHESRVRVGVRIRPQTSLEIQQGGKSSLSVAASSIRMGKRQFTFDAVFDSTCGQTDLYDTVSTPLLSSFVDGYNATILAYGQTGSGKTFTMGSEAHIEPETSSQAGLIPRFITDFFLLMQQKKDASDRGGDAGQVLLEYHLTASFLEVYGEDVFDLLDSNRRSLPLREDSDGGIVVVGLTSRPISSTTEALQVLHEGTMNRTTAATLMNLTSSRSHAVFTIDISQVMRSNAGDVVDVMTTSRFTFVDLAGSERMKKTGAEGERAREGIKINEGLLALGNVINSLADEDRLAKDKKVHVPYRQSKLTRLLQDALGGNSQTLFLACVSPSDTNASETLSTLNYANRARNIRNVPTKNVDATTAEIQRLRALTHVLQLELVKSRFLAPRIETRQDENLTDDIDQIDESVMKRDDVETYIRKIHAAAHAMIGIDAGSHVAKVSFHLGQETHQRSTDMIPLAVTVAVAEKGSSERFDDTFLEDINPDEEMAILDHLLELQQHDHDYENARKLDDDKLKEMNGELEKGESMLLQLRESLKVYHSMKSRYEELMTEVQVLESQKADLARQLEQATADPTIGCSAAIKQKLEKVEMSLSRARRETMTHREKYRVAEDQARKCKVLERKVNELKNAKVMLVKKQSEAAARYKEMTETKTKELMAMKRRQKAADKRMSKLENELSLHKKTLAKRKQFCTRLSEKLKQTESHLVKLLSMRQRDLARRTSVLVNRRGSVCYGLKNPSTHSISNKSVPPLSEGDIKATKYVFDKMVWDKVRQAREKKKYEALVAIYGETMRKVVSEVKKLEELRTTFLADQSVETESTIREAEEDVADLELKLELLDSELNDSAAKMPYEGTASEQDADEAVARLLSSMTTAALKSLMMESFAKFVEAETDRQTVKEEASRKDAALMSFQAEVDSLHYKVRSLSKDLADRKRLEESGENLADVVKRLSDEKETLTNTCQHLNNDLEDSNLKIRRLEVSLRTANQKLSESQDFLILAKIAREKNERSNEVESTMQRLHKIWEELGVEDSIRDQSRKKIEHCLEDTCNRELEGALTMKVDAEHEIRELSIKLDTMRKALGSSLGANEGMDDDAYTLQEKRQELLRMTQQLETPFRYASARRDRIINDVKEISTALGLALSDLPSDLRLLMIDQGREKGGEGTTFSMPDSRIDDVPSALPLNCLATNFLTSCEGHVMQLRVKKSETLVRVRELHQIVADLLGHMHLIGRQASDLAEESMRRNVFATPPWWNPTLAGNILNDILNSKFISSTTTDVANHLELLHKVFSRAASSRRAVSELLKHEIEKAQKTLLDIVGREVDASAAYAGFHDALFRLPVSSKDLILACITEMEALVEGIDAMTQSEIEALTVVWEALKFLPADRRNFWGMIEKEESERKFDLSQVERPFIEEWMESSVQRAAKVYLDMDKRMQKLTKIHEEVERLRSKQDTKSQILSLDSEIRIMNAKLLDFEELQCDKQRLLNKKNGGGALLKEERFRKQMQGKFSSKLGQLANLLRSWEMQEGTPFDASLLSDDVRMLLDEPDKMENWVERRTKFMSLRTVKSQTPSKRPADSHTTGPTRLEKRATRHVPGLSSPRKKDDLPRKMLRNSSGDDASTASSGSKGSKQKRTEAPKIMKVNASQKRVLQDQKRIDLHHVGTSLYGTRSPKRATKKQKNSGSPLPPFGRILSDLSSPNPTDSKENNTSRM